MHCRERAARGYDATLVGLTSGWRLAWTVRTNTMLIARAWKYLSAADEILFTGSRPSCCISWCR